MKKGIETYEAQVPDTLDLSYHAELALNGLAGTTDPNDDYLMWFQVTWNKTPSYYLHLGCDVECSPKYLDDYQLMRVVSGSDKYLEYENGLHKTLLSFVSPDDGLYYAVYNPKRPWHQNFYASAGYKNVKEDFMLPNISGIYMTTLIVRNELKGGLSDVIDKMAKGLKDCAIDKGDYAYYPEDFGTFESCGREGSPFTRKRGRGWHTDEEPCNEHAGPEGSVISYFGNQIRGISMWAQRTGNEELLEFAGKLVRFIMRPNFWGNPVEPRMMCGPEHGHVDSHFHSRGHALRGMLEYGLAANDAKVCNFVRESYEYMRSFGINHIGWIPCWPDRDPSNHKNRAMEGCFLGDALALMSRLSDSGYGDYWDDAEKMIRNTLVEAQFTRKDLIERVLSNADAIVSKHNPGDGERGSFFPNQASFDRFADRMVGNFSSFIDVTGTCEELMQCCTCNAVRGIYYAWEGITRCDGDDATINMFLNRAAPWLDINSYLPYEGKVVVNNKTARSISIRIPGWIRSNTLNCRLNGVEIRQHYAGRYLVIDGLKPRDVITLNFPVLEETLQFTANAKTDFETVYTIHTRGNTVLDISPRDESPLSYPYYLRDHMKGSKAPMKNVIRRVYPIIPVF